MRTTLSPRWGLLSFSFDPPLARWAAFLRRFAAETMTCPAVGETWGAPLESCLADGRFLLPRCARASEWQGL